jgi:hypothetical protein
MGLAEFSIKEKEEPVTLGAGLGLSEVKENTNALDKFLSVNKAAAGFNSVRSKHCFYFQCNSKGRKAQAAINPPPPNANHPNNDRPMPPDSRAPPLTTKTL